MECVLITFLSENTLGRIKLPNVRKELNPNTHLNSLYEILPSPFLSTVLIISSISDTPTCA
jgi:hypothetical protein